MFGAAVRSAVRSAARSVARSVAAVAILAATLFHAAIHPFNLKIYNLFLGNWQHYMDVCPNGNGSKPVVRSYFKCR